MLLSESLIHGLAATPVARLLISSYTGKGKEHTAVGLSSPVEARANAKNVWLAKSEAAAPCQANEAPQSGKLQAATHDITNIVPNLSIIASQEPCSLLVNCL